MGKTKQTALDPEKYKAIVDEIEFQKGEIIADSDKEKDAEAAITTNSTVPNYVKADADVIKMLQQLKVQVGNIIETMKNVQANIEDTNEDATNSGNQLDG